MINVVEFKNFTFKYINQLEPTLKNINLEIKKGEKVLIAGPSGSGKSTLGSCLNGIVPFSKEGGFRGTLTVNGIEPYESSIFEISKLVGTVLQDQDGQFIGLSVGEDVSFIDENNLVPQDEMIENTKKALKNVGMEGFINHSPQELSGGQKQSVSLAGIMRSPAEILLFDEPLANLDPYSGKHAMKLICDIQKKTGKTIIVIEHRIEDVLEQDFDRVIILNNGEVVANGTPEELFRKDMFRKFGLREPLYIEALKYSGVNLETDAIYPITKIGTSENILKVKTWCDSIKIKNKTFKDEILKVENVNFSYDEEKNILNNINFSLNRGEILALLGNNGAGKSTLCKVITGIEKESSGDIICLGKSIKKDSIKRRGEKIGFVMQNPNHMITQETLLEEVQFGLKIRGIKDFSQRAEKALEVCGLHEFRNWPVTSLSYGQKKRLTIAAILALEPEVLILDEPTAGQDYKRYKEFMNFIKEIAQNRVGIILITHDMHLALEYANRSIVLCNGTLIANDTPTIILGQTELMEKSNLKETSLSKMAEIMDLDSEILMNSFINFENQGGMN
ncbi:ABC transporter ATP-binding protein [Candidatus Cetobacterium colombiensis]|uniref:ABC transporter ATP-binding protein n=1 Tax=Candidatus Cetobacterium colombiensis TaxID=3073100 RepID=A0ABU4W981_9FUSO|nr:ABC transporter ATP-binding protein [Candidatus Cetobacterium colombiensis]MDX8336077.1 ABC transporter ATP-binding protein [Candidatus Cetobacterium colombiensis]